MIKSSLPYHIIFHVLCYVILFKDNSCLVNLLGSVMMDIIIAELLVKLLCHMLVLMNLNFLEVMFLVNRSLIVHNYLITVKP